MKTLIVSEETIRELLEAHAAMAAWYYQHASALRTAGVSVEPPDETQRAAFVAQLAGQYLELAPVARSLTRPRPFVPPPVLTAPAPIALAPSSVAIGVGADELAPAAPPPPAPPSEPPSQAPPPPAFVDPSKVKY